MTAISNSTDVRVSAQEEKRNLLARLLSHLAHEIRNPLSSLDIHVQLLEEDLSANGTNLAKNTLDRFQIIHAEIRRLENIVTRFLQLAGPSDLEVGRLSLNQLVLQTADLLRPDALEKSIKFETELEEGLPEIEADAVQLSQALINLIINALQAVPATGCVRVRTRKVDVNKVALDVVDNGPGIAPAEQSKIFEPYFTTKTQGSGLGLWITQQIILAHGGTLTVESAPAKGSTFTVCIPVAQAPKVKVV